MRLRRLMGRDGQRGAAAVEFALVLPILLLFVMGTIEWGWFFFIHQRVVNAAREGARAGSLVPPPPNGTVAEMADAAEAGAEGYLTAVGLPATGVMVNPNYVMPDASVAVQVIIRLPYQPLTGILNGIMPANAEAVAVMRWQ